MAEQVDDGFVTEWNELDVADRKRIRRLARIGRPQDSADDARLAVGFVDRLRARPWYRLFWWWLVPTTVVGVVIASMLHPIVIGVVGGLAANAVVVHRNYRRVEIVNSGLIG